MSTARAIAQEVRKLSEQAAALTRRHVLGIVLEGLSEPPPGGAALGKGEYARFIGGVPEHRAAALEALRGGGTLPAKDGVVWHYRPGIADFIRGGLTHREYAAFGARGDGKTGGVPAVMAWHADLHREAGHALPVPWLGITDTFTSHEQKTIPSWSRAWLGGLIVFSDGGHLATLTVDGMALAVMRLLGVPDLGAAAAVRTEIVGISCEEAAPALVLESATGVVADVWTLARTSQGSRVPSVSYPAVQTLNYPDEDHWTWVRYVTRKHAGTGYVRVKPGERATEDDRASWREALEGRLDLQRRLLDGQPGVIAEGPQMALGYDSSRHLSPRRLTASQNAPILVGIDGGLTPAATLAQYLGGGAELNVLAALCVERGGTHQLAEDYIRAWLASHAPWAIRARALVIHIDPSLDVPDQSNLEANPARVIRDVLGASPRHGPIDWPSRRDPLLAMLGKVNPITGRAALQLDPEDAIPLDRSLAGRWHYPLVRGQVSREAPVKNHSWSDVADSLTYLIAGVAPTRLLTRRAKPKILGANFDPRNPSSWGRGA